MERVVITGMAALTPIGNNLETIEKNLKNGVCGLTNTDEFDEISVCGKVSINLEDFLKKRDVRYYSRFINLARIAARQALSDSKILDSVKPDDISLSFASAIGGAESFENNIGAHRAQPTFIPSILPSSAASMIAIDNALRGDVFVYNAACAGGNVAIGEAFNKIRRGEAKYCLAGASDASITVSAVKGFSSMCALSREKDINKASIPFDTNRTGFVIAEGAAFFVLESLGSALLRNAKIYGEITSFTQSMDAIHITAPDQSGKSQKRCISKIFADNVKREDITYISAHGTSTKLNDAAESTAISDIFGNIPVVATKSLTGHMLSASPAVEAAFCLLSLKGFIPPTINITEVDPQCNVNLNKTLIETEINSILNLSFGFGGFNTALVIKKFK